jgi:CRP/FNR family transcriptional regulator, cyclic AMP receptor protein
MATVEKILAEHPFFEGFTEGHVKLVAGCASDVHFKPGQIIFRVGEEARKFYLVRLGKVALQMTSERRGPLTVLTVGAGEVLGWSWLFPPHKYRFSARVLEATRAFEIDGQCLRGVAEQDHDFGYHLLKHWSPVVERALDATRLQLVNVYQDL